MWQVRRILKSILAGIEVWRRTVTRRVKLAKPVEPEKARCSAVVLVRIANCGIAETTVCGGFVLRHST
jgi:hypothetical protein